MRPADRAELVAEVIAEIAAALAPTTPLPPNQGTVYPEPPAPDLRLVRRRLLERAEGLRQRAEEIRNEENHGR